MGYWVDTSRPLPHHGPRLRRVGLVGPQADPRPGPAGRGLPGRAVLPAVTGRACPTTRSPRATRPSPTRGLRPVPADLRPARGHCDRRGRPAGVDHHALDAGVQHRRRGPPGRHLRGGHRRRPRRWSSPSRCSTAGARRGLDGRADRSPAPTWSAGPTSGRSSWWSSRPRGRRHRTALRGARRLRHHRGRHRSGAPVPRLRRGRHGGLPAPTGCRSSYPVRPDGHFGADVPLVGGQFFKHADADLVKDLETARAAVPARAPTSTATRTAGAATPPLMYYAQPSWYVRTTAGQGRPAAREREDQLVPRDDQVGPVRRLAEQQHRLGALAQPLLGHAAADLALRRGPPDLRRLAGRARPS